MKPSLKLKFLFNTKFASHFPVTPSKSIYTLQDLEFTCLAPALISARDVLQRIRKLKSGKAAGPDGVMNNNDRP